MPCFTEQSLRNWIHSERHSVWGVKKTFLSFLTAWIDKFLEEMKRELIFLYEMGYYHVEHFIARSLSKNFFSNFIISEFYQEFRKPKPKATKFENLHIFLQIWSKKFSLWHKFCMEGFSPLPVFSFYTPSGGLISLKSP